LGKGKKKEGATKRKAQSTETKPKKRSKTRRKKLEPQKKMGEVGYTIQQGGLGGLPASGIHLPSSRAISVPLHLVDIILGRGTGWYLVHRFWNVSLLKQQQLGKENIVRLIRVHHPWCWMVGTGKTPEDHHYETMRHRVKKFMVLYCFSNGFPDKCGTESVVANPLFGWHFWQYLLKDVHIDIRSATLVLKNLITPSTM
jgi:hypothetical protein